MTIFSGLGNEAYDRQYSDRYLLHRMLSFLRGKRGLGIGLVLAIVGGAALNALFPILVARAVDQVGANPDQLPLLAGIAIGIGLAIWLLNYGRTYWLAALTSGLVADLRVEAFRACLHHDLSFYDEHAIGRVSGRILNDTQELVQALRLVTDTAGQFVTIILLCIFLFPISPILTLLIVGPTPLLIWIASLWRKLARSTTIRGFRALGNVNTAIQESITGITIAKNFYQEETFFYEFRAINQDSFEINLRRGLVLATFFPVFNLFLGVAYAALTYWGGHAALAGLITIGVWGLFLQSVDRFWFPISQFAGLWSQLQGGFAAAERVFALIDAKPTVLQTDQQKVPLLRGAVAFRNVNFRYAPNTETLSNFSLTIAPGESVAVVGKTGAGKSSLLKLLARFYEFQEGAILVDGLDIRSLDLRAYRHQIGIITQVPFLFAGTVADNIRYAAPNATDKDIARVARQIGDGEWLEALTTGLGTEVGERGNRLSLGQRQLVALVRVLVQDARILLLDEATASIDPFTESQIQDALRLLLRNRTSIVVAHRLSTVQTAQRIVVMEKGAIVEMGNHAALLRAQGVYHNLYQTYFRHQSVTYQPTWTV